LQFISFTGPGIEKSRGKRGHTTFEKAMKIIDFIIEEINP